MRTTTDNALSPRRGAILIHASAVVVNNSAWLFLGPQGTGKSTLRNMLSPYAAPLADDKVYLIPTDGGKWAAIDASPHRLQPPLSGEELGDLRGIPLQAVFRLYQSPEPHLSPISKAETCYHLVEAYFDFYWQKQYTVTETQYVFSNLANIARLVSGYNFYFDRSRKTINLLIKSIQSLI